MLQCELKLARTSLSKIKQFNIMWWTIVVIYLLGFDVGAFGFKVFETKNITYDIVGIFTKQAYIQRNAFIESGPSATFEDRRFNSIIIQPIRSNSYSAWRELCKHEFRPVAIFGPQDPISDGAVRDQCALANIPHIQASWKPFDPELELNFEESPEEGGGEEGESTDGEDRDNEPIEESDDGNDDTGGEEVQPPIFKKITINFYPDSDEISEAYAALLKYYQWENFSVLYEDEYGLLRIQKVLALITKQSSVIVRKLDPKSDNHEVLKDLLNFQQSRFLIDCHVDRIRTYMDIAYTLDMVNHYQHYVFMSLDTGMVADEDWLLNSNAKANMTFLSLTKFEELQDTQNRLAPRVGKWRATGGSPPVNKFPLKSLIIDDVTNHVIQAVKAVEKHIGEEVVPYPSSNVCDKEGSPWEYGALVQDAILNNYTMGLTGNVQFDSTGKRINYVLYVTEKQIIGESDTYEFRTIATWHSDTKEIVDDRNETEKIGVDIKRHTFKVISRKSKPYFALKKPCEEGDENCVDDGEPYEGFSVDLVKEICAVLKEENYEYDYEFLYDQNYDYGKYDEKKKEWSGLIGSLLNKKADLAVCDLTITEVRKKVVDFSVPIMSLGISILFVKEHAIKPDTFAFLYPYSIDVWMYIGTAYCVVSIVLYVCARISPADWENPQPCDKDPEELENIWNFKNCAWLTMGSIMTQGCDILPKAFGSRWVCSMWWFFAVIICQTYIAQLSASMTSALGNEPIKGVENLANQNKIRYGAIATGSTLEFFRTSKDKMYRSLYEVMEKNPALLVESNEEGVKRVISGNGKYAFFMESSNIDYKLRRNCDLKKVGDQLDSKDYGIAMPANSPFRKQINSAILKLKERTILANITDKWWKQMDGAKDCDTQDKTDVNDVEGDMELENLWGLFLLLILGLIFSLFITAAEFIDEVRNIVVREQVTHKEAFMKELKASLNFSQSQKPVLRNPSRAPSIVSATQSLDSEEKKKRRAAALENFMQNC